MSNDTHTPADVQRSSYTCLCNFGYYVPNQTLQGFDGHDIEANGNANGNYSCRRCPGGCGHCNELGECTEPEPHEFISMETLVRCLIGIILGSCMLCCLILAFVVFAQRKCKVHFFFQSDMA